MSCLNGDIALSFEGFALNLISVPPPITPSTCKPTSDIVSFP